MRSLSLLLITLMLVSCATTTLPQYSSNADYMAANGIVATDVPPPMPMTSTPAPVPTPPAVQEGVSGWDVLGAIVALPILLPLAMLANYPSYRGYRAVHCRSYVYKDEHHTKCF